MILKIMEGLRRIIKKIQENFIFIKNLIIYEAAGVDTVKEFRHRVAANLQPKLEEVNAAKNLCNRVPSVKEVEKMIDQAKNLDPLMEY